MSKFPRLVIDKSCLEAGVATYSYVILPRLAQNYSIGLLYQGEINDAFRFIDMNYHKESIVFSSFPIREDSYDELRSNCDIFITNSIIRANLALEKGLGVILFNTCLNQKDEINPKIRVIKDWSEVNKQIGNYIIDRLSLNYNVIAQL